MLYDIVHGDTGMAFIVYALSVADKEYLGGFVLYIENICYLAGQVTVCNQVKKIKIDSRRLIISFQPAPYHTADAAAGGMLENNLGPRKRMFFDRF